MSGADRLDEETRRAREAHLRLASSSVLDVRELLTRAYEPAALPVGLSVAVAELLREIEKAQIVTRSGKGAT